MTDILENPQKMLDRSFDTALHEHPPTCYAVASTQRSGSTKFCLDLWASGALGAPWEYFNLPHMMPLFRRLGTHTLPDYVRALHRHRSTPNGVFGHKMFISTYTLADFAGQGLEEAVLPPRVIFLRRRDKMAQARSLVRAMATQAWVGTCDQNAPEPGAEDLRAALRYLCWQEALWEQNLARRGIEPLRIWFEDHLATPEVSLARVCALLDVDARLAKPVDVLRTAIQAPAGRADQPVPFDMAEALNTPFTRAELNRFTRACVGID